MTWSVAISLFLTSSSNKECKRLNLDSCYIQDKGLNVLYHGLCHSNDITIDELYLQQNGLTRQSSSLISELTVKYKVKKLRITGNHSIGKDQQLYSILTDPFNVATRATVHVPYQIIIQCSHYPIHNIKGQ